MTTRSAHAITAEERVSDVLARDETLVEVFVRHAAHFEKLRNPTMRKMMARLVSVGQAARIAGISADILVRDLNAQLGLEAPPSGGKAPNGSGGMVEGREHRPENAPEVELDVRDLLRSAGEPFSKIMEAVAALPPGAVLRLRAIFEPAPLYDVLGKRGFRHETRAEASDDWSVWFWRSGEAPAPRAPLSEHRPTGQPETADATWLDVRGLEPPEPLLRTLAALEELPAGHTLVQVNVRVPQFLLPVLAERGYACEVDESQADRVLVRIWRP